MSENEQERTGSARNSDKETSDQQTDSLSSTDATSFFQVTDKVIFQSMTAAPEALPPPLAVSQFISQTNSHEVPSFSNKSDYRIQAEHDATSWSHFFLTVWKNLWKLLIGHDRGRGGIGNGNSTGYEVSGGG